MNIDVAVMGSGPAASAMAIRCRQLGLQTALFIEPARRKRFAMPQTLSAVLRPQLEALGFWERFQQMGFRCQYHMSSAWGSNVITTKHSICNPWGQDWFVNRHVFDETLFQYALSRGAMPLGVRILSASWLNDHWVIGGEDTQKSTSAFITTKLVVDATGRSSVFARHLGVRRFSFDRQVCISARAIPRDAPTGEVLVESEPEGWWFTVPTDSGDLSIARFTEANLLGPADRSITEFEQRLRTVPHTSARIAMILPGTIQTTMASTDRLEVCAGNGWFAVGDAAFACDPLGSQGVVRALESAERVGDLIGSYGTHSQDSIVAYNEFQQKTLERFLRDRQYFYSLEQRWPKAAFWRQRSS